MDAEDRDLSEMNPGLLILASKGTFKGKHKQDIYTEIKVGNRKQLYTCRVVPGLGNFMLEWIFSDLASANICVYLCEPVDLKVVPKVTQPV